MNVKEKRNLCLLVFQIAFLSTNKDILKSDILKKGI